MDLITLSDVPALAGTSRKPRATITIGRLDDNLRDPRYGKFAITQKHVDGWQRNLTETFGGQVSMDFDHSSDRGNGTKAACWITSIKQDGSLIKADVQFTKAGAKAVRNGDYKYTSPTFVENYTDEHGDKHGPALIGGAFTNRPVLRKGMPTLNLSSDFIEGAAKWHRWAAPHPQELAKVSKKTRKKTATLKGKGKPEFPMPDKLHARLALQFVGRSQAKGNITAEDAAKIKKRANGMLGKSGKGKSLLARDSRRQMLTREDLAKALDLPSDADSDAILAAACITLAGPSADGNADAAAIAAGAKATAKATKKAKKQKKNKTMALSAEQTAKLLSDANLGAQAAAQLAEQTFETAWNKALSEGRAAPSQEDTMRALYHENADIAIKTLDSFVPIVPTKPAGASGQTPGALAGDAPLGMDNDRFQLHTEAKALAAQKRSENSALNEADAYTLAVTEIEDRKFMMENPGI